METDIWAYLEEIGKKGSILGLKSMQSLMEELGNVQSSLKFIHVAGTNGKGSVCAMLSSILQEAGLCVGKYTSPAVFDRREQYQVNGQAITTHDFEAVISEVRSACRRMADRGKAQPTLFEVETAAAFLYFFRQKCEIVVLETGMGGETDATNIIEPPLVCVLTSISMDHMKFLGEDLAQIARIKAGIIKEGCRVAAARPAQKAVRDVLEEACCANHAVLSYGDVRQACNIHYRGEAEEQRLCFNYPAGTGAYPIKARGDRAEDYPAGEREEIELSLLGDYQVENAVCAIEAVKALREAGYAIGKEAVGKGLLNARWEGRFSVLCENPLFVMDGAHNADAAKKLSETLKRGFTNYQIIYIIGVLADKEHEEMLRIMLPLAQRVYTVTPEHIRAMDGQALAANAAKHHGQVSFCVTVKEAVKQAFSDAEAFSDAGDRAMILAFGSLSYLRELREMVKEKLQNDR